jgi:hypothetical protein
VTVGPFIPCDVDWLHREAGLAAWQVTGPSILARPRWRTLTKPDQLPKVAFQVETAGRTTYPPPRAAAPRPRRGAGSSFDCVAVPPGVDEAARKALHVSAAS